MWESSLKKQFYQDNRYSNVSYSKALEGNPGSLHQLTRSRIILAPLPTHTPSYTHVHTHTLPGGSELPLYRPSPHMLISINHPTKQMSGTKERSPGLWGRWWGGGVGGSGGSVRRRRMSRGRKNGRRNRKQEKKKEVSVYLELVCLRQVIGG